MNSLDIDIRLIGFNLKTRLIKTRNLIFCVQCKRNKPVRIDFCLQDRLLFSKECQDSSFGAYAIFKQYVDSLIPAL